MKRQLPLVPQHQHLPFMSEYGEMKIYEKPRRRHTAPAMLISVIVTLLIMLGAGSYFVLQPRVASHAAAAQVNMNCTLTVPPQPLSAQGLATPYQLSATNPKDGRCRESNKLQSAFVQGTIYDATSGKISVYNPLVIDRGSRAAIAPVVPTIPANATVALWFGFNGTNLTLKSAQNSLQDGACVNGTNGSIFGQFAYCNAPAFFALTNQAIQAGKLTPPALGTANDGQGCPTLRDFSVVDQDQSDNVTTGYLITNHDHMAQLTAANMTQLPDATPLTNGSDNGLLDAFVDPALGCTPWMAPDLANPGHMATALALNELQANAHQQAPVALVPANDPMVLNAKMQIDLNKLNAYRNGVDQPLVNDIAQASPRTYCQNLVETGAPRIVLDAPMTVNKTTPDPAVGNTLFTFLAQRFVNTYTNLTCQKFLGKRAPITTRQNGNKVAISARFKGRKINLQTNTATGTTATSATTTTNTGTTATGATTTNATTTGVTTTNTGTTATGATTTNTGTAANIGTGVSMTAGTGTTTGATPTCSFNGQAVQNCTGSVTINGQSCTFTLTNQAVAVNCPTKQ